MNESIFHAAKWAGIFLIFASMVSCGKREELAPGDYPVVEITSWDYDPAKATMTVAGRIEDPGASAITNAGIIIGENGNFENDDRLNIAQVNNGEFEVVCYYYMNENGERRSFSGGRSVQFYAFAANLETFGVSELIDSGPCEENPVTVPCSLDLGKIEYNSTSYTIANLHNYFYNGDYPNSEFIFEGGNNDYSFQFGRFVTPGIYYTTTIYPPNNSNKVYISRNQTDFIAADQPLIIRDAGNGKYEVILCTAYSIGLWASFSARFLVPMH
ncbi:MAG: hypothetical protein ACKVOK_03960 [Flavobacteriales bacterium]